MIPTLFSSCLLSTAKELCQKLIGHSAEDVDRLLLGLDNVAELGILGQALEDTDVLAYKYHPTTPRPEKELKKFRKNMLNVHVSDSRKKC